MKRALLGIAITCASVLSFNASAAEVDMLCESDRGNQSIFKYNGTVVLAKGDKYNFETADKVQGHDAYLYINTQRTRMLGMIGLGGPTVMYQIGNASGKIIESGVCEVSL